MWCRKTYQIVKTYLGFQFDMVNSSLASFTNTTNITRKEGDRDVPSMADFIIIISINTITFPCTVLLNLLVIKAVKTNSNIMLACLAVTDALTGLLGQPLFFLWKILVLFGSVTVGRLELLLSRLYLLPLYPPTFIWCWLLSKDSWPSHLRCDIQI